MQSYHIYYDAGALEYSDAVQTLLRCNKKFNNQILAFVLAHIIDSFMESGFKVARLDFAKSIPPNT